MIPESLKNRINFHAEPEEGSFLRMLRPYSGLDEEIYGDLIICLKELKPYLLDEKMIDKDIMASVWFICHNAKFWGTEPDSMLVRNSLISIDDRKKLRGWANEISFAIMMWLAGEPYDLKTEY